MKNGDQAVFPSKRIDSLNSDDPDYLPGGNNQFTIYSPGLTKRELFAAMAMQGFIGTMTNDLQVKAFNLAARERDISPQKLIAEMATIQADALLAELAKPPTS